PIERRKFQKICLCYEKELKKKYGEDQSKQELELSKEFLKKSNERMDNDNPLSCVIEKCFKRKYCQKKFVFTYGLAKNEIVLVSDSLLVEETGKGEKYNDNDKNVSKQYVWSK
ncbi:hypothetical protein RFI_29852, partial [Reticulomyxa filosa]